MSNETQWQNALELPTQAMRELGYAAIDQARLRQAVTTDLAQGWKPMAVVANAGTTSSGAVDLRAS